jgi:integrase
MEVVMGMIYKRGNVWWIKYYRNGKYFRESSKSTKKMVAKKFLDRREGEIAQGKVPGVHFDKVTFDELAEDFLRDYRINQRKSLARAERSVALLTESFGGLKVTNIETPIIRRYIEQRLEQEAANATINRELSALKRMLNLGAEQSPPLVERVPKIPMLKESNVRKGFFEHAEFLAVRDCLPDYLKGFVTFGYKTGWRASEIAKLTWAQVDRQVGIVRLEVGETKNDDARTVYLDGELKEIFAQLWADRKKSREILPYVFPNRNGTDRIKRFDKAWKKSCKDAHIGKRLFHDLRRTAVRNMVRSGVPETVAMMISGHKTRSVFDRYNITNDADLIAAAKKQETYLKFRAGTISGTIHQIDEKRANTDGC